MLVCPPGHRFAGRAIDVHELASETLIVMQEGAGVRRIVEDELRRLGLRLRDLDLRLELGLQESVRSAVLAGYGVTFISRAAVEAELASGALAEARIEGMDGRREISIARGTGRAQTRVADAFAAIRPRAGGRGRRRARPSCRRSNVDARLSDGAPTRVMRFGAGSLAELAEVCAEVGITRPLLVTTRRGAAAVGRCRSWHATTAFARTLPSRP